MSAVSGEQSAMPLLEALAEVIMMCDERLLSHYPGMTSSRFICEAIEPNYALDNPELGLLLS